MQEIIAATPSHLPQVRELFVEYAHSLDFDLCFQGFDQELASLPGDYSSPKGCILLAYVNEKPVGCIALRPLSNKICEMKRLYVQPAFRGQGLGRKLAEALLEKARNLGYHHMRLDTVPSMKAALAMYASLGFYDITPYRENPIAGSSYLENELQA